MIGVGSGIGEEPLLADTGIDGGVPMEEEGTELGIQFDDAQHHVTAATTPVAGIERDGQTG